MHDMPPCPGSAVQRFGLLSHSKWGPFPPNPFPRSPLFKINIIELPCNIIQHSHSSSGYGGRVQKTGSRPKAWLFVFTLSCVVPIR